MMLQQLQRLDYEWNDNMKKTLTAIPLALLAATLFTACGDNGRDGSDSGSYYEDHDYGYGNSDNHDRDDRNDDNWHDHDDRNDDNNDISDDFSDVGDDVKDTVDDVVDGVEDAGEGIVNGAESVVDDVTDDRDTTTNPTAE